jgi:two-component system alkaline phosphatase synthesis response regulator PhoP
VPDTRKTILIVDDDEIVLHLLEGPLEQAGFTVLKASNGRDGLATALRESVDIIVSDISMPEMDGLEFCERIRRSTECVDIPFIFLTAHRREDEKIRGLRSGADEYLVKPVNASDVVTRVEILYDRIQRKRSLSILQGNLREVSLYEMLQLFELTRKRGVLAVDGATGKGTIALSEGMLMDAAWNDLTGEDAVLEMLALKDGAFRFQAKDVPSGNAAQPISFALMEAARLTDELAAFGDHLPTRTAPLRLQRPFEGDDDDARRVSRAIADGCADLTAVQRALRMPEARLRLAGGKLVAEGCVVAGAGPGSTSVTVPKREGERPSKILVAFTDRDALSRCLSLIGEAGERTFEPGRASDALRVTLASHVYDLVCLRGEKRFAFMWELVLKTSAGAIFLLASDADREHAAFFAARAASLHKPVARMCVGAGLSGSTGVQAIRAPKDLLPVFASLRSHEA